MIESNKSIDSKGNVIGSSNWALLDTIGSHPELLSVPGNYIICDIWKPEKASKAGVALPDHVVERGKQAIARAIRVGPGQRNLLNGAYMGMFVNEGDLIVILKHAPIEISIGGHTLYVISEGDVIGKVNETLLNELLEQQELESMQEVEEVNREGSLHGNELIDPLCISTGGIYYPRTVEAAV